MGEGGGTPPEIWWLLLCIEGRAWCVSCLGLVVGMGFVGLSGCGGVVGKCWKNTSKNQHSQAYSQTHICGMIVVTLTMDICIYQYISTYIHIYICICIYV